MVWNIYLVAGVASSTPGAIIAEYEDATLTEWTDELDAYTSGFKFKMPDKSSLRNFDGAMSEIQIWRNGKFFDWGVATRPHGMPGAAGDGTAEIQCNSLLWYFHRRVFGSAFPRNMLLNPDFEDSVLLNHWNIIGSPGTAFETANVLTGTKSVRLTGTTEQADRFIGQAPAWTTGIFGDTGVLTAWFFIQDMTGPALEQRGVYLDTVVGMTSQGPSFYPITNSQPVGVWTRAQAAAQMPPSVTGNFDARIYIPKGHILVDTCSLDIVDSIGTPPFGEDQAYLLRAIIAYAQDPTQGKSDLKITSDISLTGVNRVVGYLLVDNKNIFEALAEYAKYSDGVDFAMVFPDADGSETPGSVQQRVFTTYPIIPGTSMGKGVTWDPAVLRLQVNVSTEWVEPAQDGEQITTAMIVQSGNTGQGREQGGYVDASHYGGLILETVEQAPEELSLNGLAGLAKKRCLQLNTGANIPTIKTRESASMPIVTKLRSGDIVTVDLSYGGWATWEAQYRVVKAVLDPVADSLDLTLNIVSL